MSKLTARRATLGAIVALASLAGCATPPAPPTPQPVAGDPTEGSVSFSGGAVAAGIGFQWGSGVLTFRGQTYPFRVRGLSVVDVGITRTSAAGRVRNLRRVEDFNGNYVAAAVGATVAGGVGAATMQNQNGVVIENVTTSQGARLTLAPAGVNIQLTGP